MPVKRLANLFLICALVGTCLATPAVGAIKAGTTCKKLNSVSTYAGIKFTCTYKGKKLIWTAPKPEKKSEFVPYLTLKELVVPTDFNFSNWSPLRVKLSIDANTKLINPEMELVFKVDSGKWEIPSQEIRLKPTLMSSSVADMATTFNFEFKISPRMPIGKWQLQISDIVNVSGQVIKVPTREIDLVRLKFGENESKAVEPIANVDYLSFKNKKVSRFVWPGKYVAFQTISNNYEPEVMGRILHTFDLAYKSYLDITGYNPSISREYKNLLVITEMSADDVGCGAGCGFLGATGIELQTGLFNRLYNGVKFHDQYDQAAFYELGRNFWNYARFREVLKGASVSQKWFDANTTGFAVFMRFLTMNLNEIPGGPWDNGKGVAWENFYSGMKSLIYKQMDEPGHTFANTFESGLPPYSGPLSVNDFWSSLMFYFAPPGGERMFMKSFLTNLSNRPSAINTASGVQNFVDAMSITLGKSIDSEFYTSLKFEDAKTLTK